MHADVGHIDRWRGGGGGGGGVRHRNLRTASEELAVLKMEHSVRA